MSLTDQQRAGVEQALLREGMPTLDAIATAWQDLPDAELVAAFPNLPGRSNGWGEPFCFRCGWLVPPPLTWKNAGGWLERAHLQDHRHGGSSEPLNLVALCPVCHECQPGCEDRAAGIAFVNGRSKYASIVWVVQAYTDLHYGGVVRPSRDALHKLMRAYAAAGVIVADAMRQHGVLG